MPDFKQALWDVLDQHRERWLTLTLLSQPVDAAPANAEIPEAEVMQMVDGALALIRDALFEEKSGIYEMFMESVFPGLLNNGVSLSQLASGITEWAVLVVGEAVSYLSPEQQPEARLWLARFYGKYLKDVVAIGAKG